MKQPEITLIGMGVGGLDGLTAASRKAAMDAELLIGHPRHLELFSGYSGEKVVLGKLPQLLELLKTTGKTVALLASGDPLYFGIGRFLLANLPKERVRVLSNISSVQYAFAMIKEPWDDAVVLSAHGRGVVGILDAASTARKVCILTDRENTPQLIAQKLLERDIPPCEVWLCEDLGLATERCRCTGLQQLLELSCSELNVLILIRR